ncbi:hypothetical protein ACQP00_28290 [Dactylosporangium sp. CS-047395]|uniref:hypothetical protein n=1 Tax=Dactylosporangium sp. CS-047395 TaxID=3239936 RepID=UPI003D942EBE
MVTGLLLRLAGQRWPGELRGEMLAEWSAEVHELAAAGRHWRALTFAFSLAATRPRVRRFSLVPAARQAWSGVRLLVVLPVAAVLVGLTATCLPVVGPLVGAVFMAVVGGRFVPRRVPIALLIPAVTLPGGALYVLAYDLGAGRPVTFDKTAREVIVFGWLLMIALAVAALLVRDGRQRWAWIAGIGGSLAAADIGYALRYFGDPFSPYDLAGWPLWMPTSLGVGGLGLTWSDSFGIRDDVNPDAPVFLVLAAYALGSVIAARLHARPRPAR